MYPLLTVPPIGTPPCSWLLCCPACSEGYQWSCCSTSNHHVHLSCTTWCCCHHAWTTIVYTRWREANHTRLDCWNSVAQCFRCIDVRVEGMQIHCQGVNCRALTEYTVSGKVFRGLLYLRSKPPDFSCAYCRVIFGVLAWSDEHY